MRDRRRGPSLAGSLSEPRTARMANEAHNLFYQHEDTTKDLPSYADFSSAFKGQSLEMELDYAMTNLWLCLETHAYRYKFIRNAVNRLKVAIIAFSVSVVAAAVLGLLPI
jgi:hypothetical protein